MPVLARLTDKFVRSSSTSKARWEDFWDASRPGLFLRIMPSGTRSFQFSYRQPGDMPARRRAKRALVLGHYNPDDPDPKRRFSLADAIQEWRKASGLVAQGVDPMGPARKRAEPKGGERDPISRVPTMHLDKAREIFGEGPIYPGSFGELALDYLVFHAWAAKRRTRDDEQMLKRDVLPVWRDRPCAEIFPEDVVALTDRIVMRGARVAANHVRLLVSRIYTFGMSRARARFNPAYGVKIPGGKAKARTRWASDSEIRDLWFGVERCGAVFAALVRVNIVLFQRPGEISAMEWSEFQPDGWWVIPGTKTIPYGGRTLEVGTKNKLDHAVYLPPLAWEEICKLRELTGTSRFVFQSPKRPGQPMLGIKKTLDRLLAALQLRHLTPHDLRRTGTTNLQRLGFSLVVDPLVNHQPRGVRASYNLWQFREERKQAMLAWDAHLRGILEVRGQGTDTLDQAVDLFFSPKVPTVEERWSGDSLALVLPHPAD